MTLDLDAMVERAQDLGDISKPTSQVGRVVGDVLALAEEARRLRGAVEVAAAYRLARTHTANVDICDCGGCRTFYAWLDSQPSVSLREPRGEAK